MLCRCIEMCHGMPCMDVMIYKSTVSSCEVRVLIDTEFVRLRSRFSKNSRESEEYTSSMNVWIAPF